MINNHDLYKDKGIIIAIRTLNAKPAQMNINGR